MEAHEPDGVTTASQPPRTAPKRRASATPSSAYPLFQCICPQQVCSSGNSTSCPSRSSRRTTALPVSGNSVSLKQVTKSATRNSARVGDRDAAVHVEDVAGALGRAHGREEVQRRLGDVGREHVHPQCRAPAVELLELALLDAVRLRTLGAPGG